MTDRQKRIGKQVRFSRKNAGFSQGELATKVGYKSATPISLIESGKRGLLAMKALDIAKTLNVSVEDFLKETN